MCSGDVFLVLMIDGCQLSFPGVVGVVSLSVSQAVLGGLASVRSDTSVFSASYDDRAPDRRHQTKEGMVTIAEAVQAEPHTTRPYGSMR